jgi:hypothetical protein
MTLSSKQREHNRHLVLQKMLTVLDGRRLSDQVFDPASLLDLAGVAATTWSRIQREGLLRSVGGGVPPLYFLSGRGWLAALEATSQLEGQRDRALALIKALKRKVKGRRDDAVATIHDFAADGIDDGFVFNAVESGLLESLFPNRGYRTTWLAQDAWNSGAPHFLIPRDFGLPDNGA